MSHRKGQIEPSTMEQTMMIVGISLRDLSIDARNTVYNQLHMVEGIITSGGPGSSSIQPPPIEDLKEEIMANFLLVGGALEEMDDYHSRNLEERNEGSSDGSASSMYDEAYNSLFEIYELLGKIVSLDGSCGRRELGVSDPFAGLTVEEMQLLMELDALTDEYNEYYHNVPQSPDHGDFPCPFP